MSRHWWLVAGISDSCFAQFAGALGVLRVFDWLLVALAMLKAELKLGRQVGARTNSICAGDMGIVQT